VFDDPVTIIKLVMVLILAKAIVLFTIAKFFKFNTQDSLLFSLTLAQGGEFCFVLLSHAVLNRVLAPELANQLVVVVAISMIFTPLLIIFYEKILEPFFIRSQETKEFDTIEGQKNPVVIAGFGRYGQIIGRLLFANKIKATVLDLDADNIVIIRKFGFKVFYGDASRLDLLQAAGIEHAKLFILAIDDPQGALAIAMLVRTHYPHIKILARVRGRTQAYEFLKEDFHEVYRETFDSSLAMGVDALKALGYPAYYAWRSVRFFRKHDEASLERLFKLYGNEKEYMDAAKKSRKNLEKAFTADHEGNQFSFDQAWDPENAKERG
jgi:glutathione-regulated potassium-efflux system ancillary protein KefC/glutathione-regulated potassium-efflux system protein KefB